MWTESEQTATVIYAVGHNECVLLFTAVVMFQHQTTDLWPWNYSFKKFLQRWVSNCTLLTFTFHIVFIFLNLFLYLFTKCLMHTHISESKHEAGVHETGVHKIFFQGHYKSQFSKCKLALIGYQMHISSK